MRRLFRRFSYISAEKAKMDSLADFSSGPEVLQVQNNVVSISLPKNPNEKTPSFLREIEIDGHKAIVIAIFEKYFVALTVGNLKSDSFSKVSFSNNKPDVKTFSNISSFVSSHVQWNFSLFYSQNMLEKSRLKFSSRKPLDSQIMTGTWQIDILKPIGQGHYVIFKGTTATGKTSTIINTASSFIKLSSSNYVVYIGRKSQKIVSSIFSEEGNDELRKQLITIDTTSGSNTETLLSYKSGISIVEGLSLDKKNVFFVMDDFYNEISWENDACNSAMIPFLPWKSLQESYAITGNFETHSVTTAIVLDSQTIPQNMNIQCERILYEAESYADTIYNFELSDDESRLYFPMIMNSLRVEPEKWQSPILFRLRVKLTNLLKEVEKEKKRIEILDQLGFSDEEYDSYLYLDSQWFMKILQYSQFQDIEEMILTIAFLIRTVETDVTGYFKEDPKNMLIEYFEFVRGEGEWRDLKKNNKIMKARDFLSLQISLNAVEEMEECLNYLYEQFFLKLKLENRLFPFKNDYL